MKRLVVLASCFLLIAGAANAQKPDSLKKAKAKSKVENLDSTQKKKLAEKGVTKENMKDLDLSADQAQQIDKMRQQKRQEREKIANDNSLTQEQKDAKIKALNEDFKSKSGALLTKEQKQKIKQNKINAKEKRQADSTKPQ